jgi:hypothetical protein
MKYSILGLAALALLLGDGGQLRAGFVTFDPPGSTSTFPQAISGNNVIGGCSDSNFNNHNFLYNASTSTYTILNVPGSTFTSLSGVSGNNVVGSYDDSNFHEHGFLYNALTSTYTTLDPPGSTGTFANGVSSNQVVGSYADSNFQTHGFLFTSSAPEPASLTLLGIGITGLLGYRWRRQGA